MLDTSCIGPNISKVVNVIQTKHEDRLTGLEDRISKVEKTTKSIEQTTKQEIEKIETGMKTNILDNLRGDIDRLAESRNTELEDRKQRGLNIIIFNLEWHNHDNGENNKKRDENDVRRILSSLSIQEVFHVYLNKFEIAISHLFLIILGNNEFTFVNLISRNAQPPLKYLLTLFAGLKQSLKRSSQNLSI